MGGFDLFVIGRSHFLLSERSLSFNNVMIILTSALALLNSPLVIHNLVAGIFPSQTKRYNSLIILSGCFSIAVE